MPLSRKMSAGYAGLSVLSVIWGLAFVAIRVADLELSPVNLALLRWLVAGVLYLILLPLIGRSKVRFERKDIPRLLIIAFANVAGYHLSLNYAETMVSAGLSGILISFGPVFIVLLSAVLLDERITAKVVFALAVAILGALVLSYGSINLSDLASLTGPGAVVLAAFFYALFSVLAKPLVHKYGSAPMTLTAGLLGTVMLLPLLSNGFIVQVASLSLEGWLAVLYLSVLSTTLGYLLFYTLVSRGAVSRLSIQLYLAPVFSVIGGALLLGESITVLMVIGGGMMLLGVALATWK